MFGSEGLCPHCRHKAYCSDSTYRINKISRQAVKEELKRNPPTGGSEDWNKPTHPCAGYLTYVIEGCNSLVAPGREHHFEESD